MCTHSRVAATSLSWRIPFSYHRNAHVDHPHDRTDYRYDPVGRLLESIGPAGKERFAFDPACNIIDPARVETARKESRPSPVRAESSLPPEVPKVLGNLLKQYAGQHFEYDARGNLVQRRSPAGEQRYEWDPFNRLTAASVEETARRSESRYYYDALGRRIAKEVNGERTVFEFKRSAKDSFFGGKLNYSDNECNCRCSSVKAGPIIARAEGYANRDVVVPPGVAHIPIGSNR